jgi:serralysin
MPTISMSPEQAGEQITRGGYEWGTNLGEAVGSISFGFRDTAPAYNNYPHNQQQTFGQFTAKQIDDATRALSLWSDLANISFVRVGEGVSGESAFTDDATILFGSYYADRDGAAAFAFYADPNGMDANDPVGDVWVNRYYDERATTPETYRFMTLLHEIGHALGLQHPGDYNAGGGVISYENNAAYIEDSRQYSLMSYWSAANTGAYHAQFYAGTPLLDDIVAIQRLYGANMTTRTDDTVYGFNSNTEQDAFHLETAKDAPIFAVWDAGGIDTFDFSGFADDQVLDLREGMFSNVGRLTLNVAIAPGAVIENAIGGSGDDIIIGNDADNALFGHRGRDKLIGGDGDDSLSGGWGKDRLQGGGGADLFVFDSVRGHIGSDVIVDFDIAEGDRIDLSSIDARRQASGDQAFHFIGGHRFTEHAGQLRYKQGVVSGDLNGDGRADFRISVHLHAGDDAAALGSNAHVTADDFIL